MITEYFNTEELEHELREDYHALKDYQHKRKARLGHEIKRARKKRIIRPIQWKSPKHNNWYFTEDIIRSSNNEYKVAHFRPTCIYKFNGKFRTTQILFSPEENMEKMEFWHFSFHFFNRLKQRMNWKLNIEDTVKKFSSTFKASMVYNQFDQYEDGTYPMTCISSYGLLLGMREIEHPHHYWVTTFLNTGILQNDQKEIDRILRSHLDDLSKKWPENFVDKYKNELLTLLKKYKASSPNMPKAHKESKTES